MQMSETEKHQSNFLGCHSSEKLGYLPIKKRRFLFQSPSPLPQIPSSVNEENPNFSKSQGDHFQSLAARSVSFNSKLGAWSVDKADVQGNYPKKVNGNFKSIEDVSGMSIRASGSSLGRELSYAGNFSKLKESSLNTGPVEDSTNSGAHSFSNVLVKEECVDLSVGGASSCVTTALAGDFPAITTAAYTSENVKSSEKRIKEEPFHEDCNQTVSLDVSSIRDEDIVGSQNLQSQDHRLHWDLNVVMDAWEQPSDHQNAHISDYIYQGSGIDVRCAINRYSAQNHDLIYEPETSSCDDKKKLLHDEPRKSLDLISQGNSRNQVYHINHENQIVSMCDMSFSSKCKNVPGLLSDTNGSVQPLIRKSMNETPPILKSFDIKKYVDNEPTGESMNFSPLFSDHRNLSVSSVPDINYNLVSVGAAVTKNTSVPVIDTQVRLTARPSLDIENELTKSMIPNEPFDDIRQSPENDKYCAKINMTSQVNNDATMEKVQKKTGHPQRSVCLHEFTVSSYPRPNDEKVSMEDSERAKADVHVSIKEVKMESAEHIEEKVIPAAAAADSCATDETEAAGRIKDDCDSQYEDGELREPTRRVWGEYDAVNKKTEHIDYVCGGSSSNGVTASNHDSESGQIRRIKSRDGCNTNIFSSVSGAANVPCPESDWLIADDNGYGKDDNLLKLVHSVDERMEGPASGENLESNKMSLATVVRVRDDCDRKGRIYDLATKSPDSKDTDTRNGSTVFRRTLPSQIKWPVGNDVPFREVQAVSRSKLDGVAARWDQGCSNYMKSSERVRYSMQSQPRLHLVNSWDGSSDVCRVIKPNHSPNYGTEFKPDNGDDTVTKEDGDGTPNIASYSSQPLTNDEFSADVDMPGNLQLNHKPHGFLGSDRLMSRGRFIRHGRQMDHGAGRGRYHGPSNDDNNFLSSLKSRRRPLSQRDISFSPNGRRGYSFARQSHSRSKTRSPDPKVSPRSRSAAADCERLNLRHKSRSPNLKSESRTQRVRSPPNHQRFGADRTTGFRPFQKDNESLPSSKWINSRNDELDHFTCKQQPIPDKSPNTVRFSDSSKNTKPDGYYRQNTARFSEMDGTGRQNRLEEIFENRRKQFGPIAKRLRHDNDGFVSTNRNVAEFHGRGNRDATTFMYKRGGKFGPHSKQFGLGGMNSSRNLKSGEQYKSINSGRYNEINGAGRGHRYVSNNEGRRRHFNSVYFPKRGEKVCNLPVQPSSCNDVRPTGQREEQGLELSGQEMKIGETSSKSTDFEVPADK